MLKKEKPFLDNTVTLEKLGSWTIARLPNFMQSKPFGKVRVCGTIDGFEISKYFLQPVGQGRFFLPVKAEIRKAISKKTGDKVHIILYPDHSTVQTPEELINCLKDEPRMYKVFNSYTDSERKAFVDWIYSAKKEETRIGRIAKMLRQLEKGLTLYDVQKKIKGI